MRKYLTFLVVLIIIYNIFSKLNLDNSILKSVLHSNLDDVKKYDFQGGWLEKKVAVIATNMMQTPQGRQFFEQLVQTQAKTPAELLNFKTDINDFVNKIYQAEIIKKGEGDKAVCGNAVEVEYKLFNENNILQRTYSKKILLGNGDIEQIIENSIVGMQAAEIKNITLLNSLFSKTNSKDKLTAFRAQVILKSIDTRSNFGNVKVFDDMMDFSIPMLCGDQAFYDLSIQDITGKQVYKQQQAKVKIGDKNCPTVLAFGLYGKKFNGIRTLIVKGADIVSLIPNSLNKNISSENFYLLELKNVSKSS